MAGQESHAHSSDQTSDHRRCNKGNGPVQTLYLEANKTVLFQLTNTYSTEAAGAATITFGFIR